MPGRPPVPDLYDGNVLDRPFSFIRTILTGPVLLSTGEVLLPSLRRYSVPAERHLALFVVSNPPTGSHRCAVTPLFEDGFEDGTTGLWSITAP
jgi:hypothetical protein